MGAVWGGSSLLNAKKNPIMKCLFFFNYFFYPLLFPFFFFFLRSSGLGGGSPPPPPPAVRTSTLPSPPLHVQINYINAL